MTKKKVWRNFRTVEQWIQQTIGVRDCRMMCSGCAALWPWIKYGHVHMVEDSSDPSPCGLPHKYYCDNCINEAENE